MRLKIRNYPHFFTVSSGNADIRFFPFLKAKGLPFFGRPFGYIFHSYPDGGRPSGFMPLALALRLDLLLRDQHIVILRTAVQLQCGFHGDAAFIIHKSDCIGLFT